MERQRNKGMHYIINANRCKKNAWECIHDHRIMYLTCTCTSIKVCTMENAKLAKIKSRNRLIFGKR